MVEGKILVVAGVDLPQDVPQPDSTLHRTNETQLSRERVLRGVQVVQQIVLGLFELVLERSGLGDFAAVLITRVMVSRASLLLEVLRVPRGAGGILGRFFGKVVVVAPVPRNRERPEKPVDAHSRDA